MQSIPEKGRRWVPHGDTLPQEAGAGVTRRILAYTDGLMCVENTFEAGSVGAPHSHPHTQITYVMDGALEFTMDGETKIMRKGDSVFIKPYAVHKAVAIEDTMLIDMFAPMREDFIE